MVGPVSVWWAEAGDLAHGPSGLNANEPAAPGLNADSRKAMLGHDRARPRILSDRGLLRGGDIHDHPAFEHLCEPTLHARGPPLFRHGALLLLGR